MQLHHVLELILKLALIHLELHDVLLAALQRTGLELADLDFHLDQLRLKLLLLCLETGVFGDLFSL